MWSNVAAHPWPAGDWARKPTRTRSRPRVKYRSSRQQAPSVEAWNAQAAPDRVIRSHRVLPSASKELQSSEVPLVTTVTAVGRSCGEYSKQSLAQSRSAACSSSTPASYMLANSTLTCAASVKSPAGGSPVNRPASGTRSAPAGSTNRSVFAAAISVSTPLLTRHPGGGLPSGSSANGKPGSFNEVTRVVSHGLVYPPARRQFHADDDAGVSAETPARQASHTLPRLPRRTVPALRNRHTTGIFRYKALAPTIPRAHEHTTWMPHPRRTSSMGVASTSY